MSARCRGAKGRGPNWHLDTSCSAGHRGPISIDDNAQYDRQDTSALVSRRIHIVSLYYIAYRDFCDNLWHFPIDRYGMLVLTLGGSPGRGARRCLEAAGCFPPRYLA